MTVKETQEENDELPVPVFLSQKLYFQTALVFFIENAAKH